MTKDAERGVDEKSPGTKKIRPLSVERHPVQV